MQMQGKAVLIKPDALPEKTGGGIIVPKTAKEPPNTGIVLDCGPACETVSIGDRVHYPRKAASVILDDAGGTNHFILEEKIIYIE